MVYGDTGYPCRGPLASPFRGVRLTEQQQAWNAAMCRVRISVEWFFGIAARLWQAVHFRPSQRALQSPIAQQFAAMVLFTNAHACLRGGNQISHYFGCCQLSLGGGGSSAFCCQLSWWPPALLSLGPSALVQSPRPAVSLSAVMECA